LKKIKYGLKLNRGKKLNQLRVWRIFCKVTCNFSI